MVFPSFQSLSPAGLLVDEVEITTDRICISARCRAIECQIASNHAPHFAFNRDPSGVGSGLSR